MNYYYILEDGSRIQSKWQKEPGERHLNTKVKQTITEEEYEAYWSEVERRQAAEQRHAAKRTNLWFAGVILEAGHATGVPLGDTLSTMRDFAPASFKALKSALNKRR